MRLMTAWRRTQKKRRRHTNEKHASYGGTGVFIRYRSKVTCLGFCDRERDVRVDDPRAEYDEEVILVSGECDLGARPGGTFTYAVAYLLRREYKGHNNTDELAQLNQVGDELSFCNYHGE
jgi:hypothetical protein